MKISFSAVYIMLDGMNIFIHSANGCNGSPTSWIYSSGSCYQMMEPAKNYESAKTDCKGLHTDAHVAVVNSAEENKFVRGIALDGGDVWLGCSDGVTEGTWECLDRSNSTFDFASRTGTGYWGKNY